MDSTHVTSDHIGIHLSANNDYHLSVNNHCLSVNSHHRPGNDSHLSGNSHHRFVNSRLLTTPVSVCDYCSSPSFPYASQNIPKNSDILLPRVHSLRTHVSYFQDDGRNLPNASLYCNLDVDGILRTFLLLLFVRRRNESVTFRRLQCLLVTCRCRSLKFYRKCQRCMQITSFVLITNSP